LRGAEPFQERHYGLVRWFLATLFRVATRVFRLRVEIEEPDFFPFLANRLGPRPEPGPA